MPEGRYSVVKARRRTQAPDGYEYVRPQGTSIAGIMPVRLGLNVVGLLTAEITTASTLKTMSTRKAKLHMGAQAIIYLCVATMNQFTTRQVTWLRVRLPSSLTVTDAARRLLVPRTIQPDLVFA